MEELKKRKTPRHQSFDYNSAGVYFITICTQNKRPILSRIVGTGVLDCPSVTGGVPKNRRFLGCDCVLDCPSVTGDFDCSRIELTRYGKIADKYINQLNDFYTHLSIEAYVIMPNHIHLLLWVKEDMHTNENGQSRTPVPTNVEKANSVCSKFVSTFKRFCNKEYGENIWQSRFNDHIIRNSKDYEEHEKYIYENPIRWCFDALYSEE